MQKMNQEKDLQFLEKRFSELSRIAYQRDIVTYTDFLNLSEQNILHMLPKDRIYSRFLTFGGYESAERQMAAFIPEALYLRCEKNELSGGLKFPFSYIKISPINRKYSEELNHRDYLGAILNLGIERNKTGDIITGDGDAIAIIQNDMAEIICNELTRIRRTSVSASMIETDAFHYRPRYQEIRSTVASVRLDSLLSAAFSASRNKLSGLIEGAKVYVNGKLITSNGYQPSEGDIISVRGMGKFRFEGCGKITRKNRISVIIQKYM